MLYLSIRYKNIINYFVICLLKFILESILALFQERPQVIPCQYGIIPPSAELLYSLFLSSSRGHVVCGLNSNGNRRELLSRNGGKF